MSNNTVPDGSGTVAVQGLMALSEELTQNSGIRKSWMNWLESWFSKDWWKNLSSIYYA